ncbi:MAG: CRISPR-associated helicase Cas3' [Candidatus Xenobiia bacterium LiM19]
MKEFYAKPDQTYREHIEAVYSAWKETIEAKSSFIDRLSRQFGFSAKRFKIGSLLTIALHDVGKLIEPFQQIMDDLRKGRNVSRKNNYRHELLSFIYAVQYWNAINKQECLSRLPVEALAVASHHKTLDSDLTSFQREAVYFPIPAIDRDGLEQAIFLARELFEREVFDFPDKVDISKLSGKKPYESLASLFSGNCLNTAEVPERLRILYSLLKAVLHYADWHGSGGKSVIYSVTREWKDIIQQITGRCRAKGINFTGLRPFQEDCGKHSGHLIAIAPTGSGKTEASILWAINNTREMNGGKILYLLPTMVTANSIWSRLTEFFGSDNVGLTHSTANLILEGQFAEDESDKWENRKNYLFDQTFIKPVTVGTVDQLLTTGFNAGRWALKEINAANSAIILDEIHAYDEWTLGLVVSTIKHFSALGARFLIMSATMPSSLQNIFIEVLGNLKVIRDEALLNEKRSVYYVEDRLLEDSKELVEKACHSKRRVLIVANTVELCQSLARDLSHLKPVCYHSQYILKDRKTKEDELQEAKLLIATQVVEVSLDIDYDWLYTECAPPDAIAQRAGRVNRYRDPKRDSRVYIFRASDKSRKLYEPINDSGLLSRSFEALKHLPSSMSENDLNDFVERVYKDRNLKKSEVYMDALAQYKVTQKNRNMIFDSRVREDKQEVTRQIKYEKVSVIPKCFENEIMRLSPSERRWYEIKLPLWYVQKNKEVENGITLCDVEYDSKYGATLKHSNEPTLYQF